MTTTPQPPPRYGEFTQQYFAGAWRDGRSLTHTVVDTNPYNGSVCRDVVQTWGSGAIAVEYPHGEEAADVLVGRGRSHAGIGEWQN